MTTDYNSDRFTVLLGNGSGGFQATYNYQDGISAIPLAAGDLNGDGNADLVLAGTYGNSIEAFLGTGNGTFGPAIPYGTNGSPGGFGNNGLLLADVDGNGSPDVVVTNLLGNTVSLLLNLPIAAFSSSGLNFGSQPVGTSSAPMTLSVYDAAPLALNISAVKISGEFVEQNHCPHTLTSGGCQIQVEFRPTTQGTRTGTLVIGDDGQGGSQTILLTGQGTPSAVDHGARR